jgi:O-acetylhomoserine (thiol)-lyase
MPGSSDPGFDTLALHAGAAPDPATGARAVPIHLSTSFVFESSEHAASLFNMERSGHVYSRISNPTNAVLEERMAALEGGVGRHRHRQRPGGAAPGHRHAGRRRLHIVASSALYGGSHNLLHYTLRASASRPPSSSRATSTAGAPRSAPNTRLLFGETLGNPGLDVLDIPTVAPSRTRPACRCWWTRPSPRPG